MSRLTFKASILIGHNSYDRVRHDMAIDGLMRTEDNAADNRYYLHLKTSSGFLESKAFRNLFKTKIAIEGLSSDADPSPPSTPSFREETQGERKHILKEMDVIRRNPQLRQMCLDGFQPVSTVQVEYNPLNKLRKDDRIKHLAILFCCQVQMRLVAKTGCEVKREVEGELRGCGTKGGAASTARPDTRSPRRASR